MNLQNEKCVMVVDSDLPLGFIANTAAIMGFTLGKHIPNAVGPDVLDQDGNTHLGIIDTPIPILRAGKDKIKELRQRLYQPEFSELTVVDFSDVAQGCNVYEEFIDKISQVPEQDMIYMGIGIYGAGKLVKKLTGSMPLLR